MTPEAALRIARLRRRHDRFLESTSPVPMCDPDQRLEAARIARESCARASDLAQVVRHAAFLEDFAATSRVVLDPDELIVGSMLMGFFREPRPADLLPDAPWFEGNGGHVVVDYGRVLRLGIPGLLADIAGMSDATPQQRRNRDAFRRAVEAFRRFIRRHADAAAERGMDTVASVCEMLTTSRPHTFHEALQLTWFTQVFLHAEASSSAISFGRLDQFLWPFLEVELADGATTLSQAEELLACFWLKCCEGGESQNVILGGCDATGASAETPLSCLCLKVTRELRVWQPSVSVRIGPGTSDAFWDLALELCAEGFGMPSFFNDPVVIRAVQATGIPVERARDWAVVGCYEATPQGDCLARTVHGNWVLASTFRRYLDSCSVPGREPDTFADFRQGLKAFLAADYAALVPQFQNAWNWMRDHQASPFRSVCMEGCCESGLCAEEGGTRHKLFGVDILGLGTLVDSVWAVQRLVYEEGAVTLAELCEQLAQDLPDARFLSRCRNLPGKYGSDSPATNALASELAHHVADLVLESRMEHGVQPFPAFFIFTAWAQLELPATPDGRRSGEPVSYGVGPSVYAGYRTPTGMLRSAAVAAHDRCACGNPMLLTLDHRTVQGRDGRARIRQLVEAYFEQGGFHLHFNVLEADELRDARQNPARHMDLLVRISGLSAQFVSLEARLQAALIERAEAGM